MMKGIFVILFVCVAGSLVQESFGRGPRASSNFNGIQLNVEDYLVEEEADLAAIGEHGRQKRSPCLKDIHHKSCLDAAARGECTKDGFRTTRYMGQNCCESCAMLCAQPDIHYKSCQDRVKRGECRTNAKYMEENCCQSCAAVCTKDIHHNSCKDAAARGDCTKVGYRTPAYMAINCCESCAAIGVTFN